MARVWLTPGTGEILINDRKFEDYFPTAALQNQLLQVFHVGGVAKKFDCRITACGGGITGQVGAIRLGVARALLKTDPLIRSVLKEAGFLRRDPRAKERKKSGQPGARKRFQFSKR